MARMNDLQKYNLLASNTQNELVYKDIVVKFEKTQLKWYSGWIQLFEEWFNLRYL